MYVENHSQAPCARAAVSTAARAIPMTVPQARPIGGAAPSFAKPALRGHETPPALPATPAGQFTWAVHRTCSCSPHF